MENMQKIIYCDMDGVLADFNSEPNAVERFRVERGFFKKLKPLANNIKALKMLSRVCKVYILSASPHKRADKDKIAWLKENVPFINLENVILIRNGQNKVNFMKTKKGILLDDYGKNCRDWLSNRNNISFKISEEQPIQYYINRILLNE